MSLCVKFKLIFFFNVTDDEYILDYNDGFICMYVKYIYIQFNFCIIFRDNIIINKNKNYNIKMRLFI